MSATFLHRVKDVVVEDCQRLQSTLIRYALHSESFHSFIGFKRSNFSPKVAGTSRTEQLGGVWLSRATPRTDLSTKPWSV